MLPEDVLFHIESGTLSAQTDHLGRLQWRHLLLDYCRLLTHAVPFLWELLQSGSQIKR